MRLLEKKTRRGKENRGVLHGPQSCFQGCCPRGQGIDLPFQRFVAAGELGVFLGDGGEGALVGFEGGGCGMAFDVGIGHCWWAELRFVARRSRWRALRLAFDCVIVGMARAARGVQ